MTDWNELLDKSPASSIDTTPMAKLEDLALMGECSPAAVEGCPGPITIMHRSGFKSVWVRQKKPWWRQVSSERVR